MGGIKSKVFGETEFKEDKFKNEILKDKQIDRLEAEELQEEKTSNTIEELSINYKEPQNFQFTSSLSTLSTGSFQDLNENCLTVRNDNVHLETLKNSELNNNNNNSKSSSHHFPLLDLSLLETKHQQKIRPYTLFNQNRINNTKNNIQNKENNNNNKMETIPTVTSFQPPNHLQKNQYFRSFRMASRRIFNPNVNNDNKNKQPTSNDSESDKIKKNTMCKSTENMTAFKPQPKPRASNELNKTATFIATNNNNNNNITNNAIIAQSNLNDSNKNETKLINLDTKIIKLDNLEINNNNNDVIINNNNKSNITTNILENNNLEKQQSIINKAVPNLKSKSTVDFVQTKHIPFIQTSATSTKLTEAKLASKNNNRSFRNQNFTSAGYFNSIKKRFSNQLNKETLPETVTNNKETEESNMLNSFDPRNFFCKFYLFISIIKLKIEIERQISKCFYSRKCDW